MKITPRKLPLLLCSATLAVPLVGYSAEPGKATQVNAKPTASGHQAAGHHRGPKRIALTIAEDATLTLWKPDLSTLPLKQLQGTITLPKTGMDNYHAIIAEKDWGSSKEAIIRYEYMRGKPSGHSTRELTSARKTDFEIVPQPVPREHWRYYSDQTWSFMTRFGDQPVADVPVVLKTSNGSTIEAKSDGQGMVSLHIPDDFPDVVEGERDMRTADFMIHAEHTANGISYRTALSASYRINQAHWKSFELGVLVVGIGMIAGGYIGRVRKDKGKKA